MNVELGRIFCSFVAPAVHGNNIKNRWAKAHPTGHGHDGRATGAYYSGKFGVCQTESISIFNFEFLILNCRCGCAETEITGGNGLTKDDWI